MRSLGKIGPRGRSRLHIAAGTGFAVVLVVLYFTSAITGEKAQYIMGDPSGGKSLPPQMQAPPPAVTHAPALPDQTMIPPQEVVDPNEVHWTENGELMGPAPKDPAISAAAIEQAIANGRARAMGRAPDAQYAATADPFEPVPHHVSTYDVPSRAGETFTVLDAENAGTYNLRLPDLFEPTLEQMQESSSHDVIDEELIAPMASTLIQDFGGIDQTTLTPPDPDIAAGPDHVVVVVNSRFAYYDKCGNNLFETNFADFVGNTTDFFFDPKVVYDRYNQRYIMTICVRNNTSQASWVLLLISDDNNPVGGWCYWYFSYGSTYWADYQDVGTYLDGVIITANMFDWSTPNRIFQYSHVRLIETADLLTCAAASSVSWTSMTNPNDGTLAFSIRPSDQMSWGVDYWMINSVSYGGDFLTLWSINGGWTSPTLLSWDMAVGLTYNDPPPMQQGNGTYVDCGDARLLGSCYYAGNLWATHGRESGTKSAIACYQVSTTAKTVNFNIGLASSNWYAYPAVDFDKSYDGVITFSAGGTATFPGTRYVNLPLNGPWSGSSLLVAGQAWYAGGAAGTSGDPYRWGDYYGCDLDPFDDKTLWFFGQFASNAPTPSWDTHVGATTVDGAGNLTVTPTAPFVSTGLQGGPFTPGSQLYTIQNTGGAATTWSLTGLESWESASNSGDQIGPGNTQYSNVSINSNANALTPGFRIDYYNFTDCYNGAVDQRRTELTVGIDGSCPGSVVDLIPPTPPDVVNQFSSDEDRGVYVTAIKDFEICAIGMQADFARPQILSARIYAANGTTRGALLASGNLTAVQPGKIIHYIPINYTLQECQEYDIAISFNGSATWDWFSEMVIAEPFDAGGIIRVRNGEFEGGAGNFALPYYSIIGSEPACEVVEELNPGYPPGQSGTDGTRERGFFCTANRTISMCTLDWKANLIVPQPITAKIYEATGTTRGALIAEGSAVATQAGNVWHNIPVNVTLLEGNDYELDVEFGNNNYWDWWDERPLMPNSLGPFDNIDATNPAGSGAGNIALPVFRVGYAEPVDGALFDLAKQSGPHPPPNVTSHFNDTYGAYVTSLINQEMYTLGWYADVPVGQPITATIYQATGTTRGALISQGTVLSAAGGYRWHDIPVAASLVASGEYDFDIEFATTTEWRWWPDTSGLPYDAYGVIRVRDGHSEGDASNGALIHMRYNGCNSPATAVVDDGPQRTPMFLATPAPNPISSTASIRFQLEQNEAVTMTVYDVKGRRVATILSGENRPMGQNTVELNAGDLPSGVYFVKLSTKLKSMTRKFVVTH